MSINDLNYELKINLCKDGDFPFLTKKMLSKQKFKDETQRQI
jgi:hypothetical protein